MALSDPKEYFKLIIEPSLRRFQEEPTAFDLAFACCITIAHFRDVYAKAHGLSLGDATKRFQGLDDLFSVVHAMADTAKHVEIGDKKHGTFVGLSTDATEVAKGAAFSEGSYFSDGSSFAEHTEVVRVRAPNGHWYDLLHSCQSVVKSLRQVV